MELREKLYRLKEARKLTTESLSERSGVPRGTINKLLTGETRNPTAQTLRKLAEALECPLEELLGKPSEIPGVRRLSEPERPAGSCDLIHIQRRRIPVLGEIAAGEPIFCDEDVTFADCDAGNCDFALRVHGDSMIGARLFDGDLVFIRRQSDVDDGQIAAVLIDGHATLKRVYHIPGGLHLLSENPKYPPMRFTLSDHDHIQILGLAVSFHAGLAN